MNGKKRKAGSWKLPHGGEKWGFVHIGFMVLTALALISFLVVLFTGGIFFVAGGE